MRNPRFGHHRIVLHIDMDAFFAAIEERDHPDFRGFPIVVGADPKGGRGRGVVATANYEARKYAVRSAQPISQAWRFCQEGEARGGKPCIFFRGNFDKYERESQRIFTIVRRWGEKFEQVSIDEAYLEIQNQKLIRQSASKSVAPKTIGDAEVIAREIKKQIFAASGLTCSIGIGPNKLVAKVASDFRKPDGCTVVPPEYVQAFLDPLPIRAIPGIGPKAEAEFKKLGVATIRHLRVLPRETLEKHFGSWGEHMYERARGLDDRPVGERQPMKSLGREQTFLDDVKDPTVLLEALKELAREVAEDVAEEHVAFRTVELKVRFDTFETHTRQITLAKATQDRKTIERSALRLFLPFLDRRENPCHRAVRLLGIRVRSLS